MLPLGLETRTIVYTGLDFRHDTERIQSTKCARS